MANRAGPPAHASQEVTLHLRHELGRVLELLSWYLQRQRRRGRTPAGDSVGGLVIEDGEAEGLIADLAAALASNRADVSAPQPAPQNDAGAVHASNPQSSGF